VGSGALEGTGLLVLNRALPFNSTVIRRAVAALTSLGLLEINAALTGPEYALRERRLIEALLDLGWNEENAARAFAIIREADLSLLIESFDERIDDSITCREQDCWTERLHRPTNEVITLATGSRKGARSLPTVEPGH
jgi:hypothetical protein